MIAHSPPTREPAAGDQAPISTTFDTQAFRRALGRFATGVTIVTTRSRDGRPVGVTANSFNSVSLDPPMVLWSLAKSSGSFAEFSQARRFAIHVLAADQQDLSDLFASRGADKFANLELAAHDLPLLPHCAARFVCRTAHVYEGGDHVIIVGEVCDLSIAEVPPLLFHGGRYTEARCTPDGSNAGIDPEIGRIGPASILNLVAEAHTQIRRQLGDALLRNGLAQAEFLAMSVVSQCGGADLQDLVLRLEAAGHCLDQLTIHEMVAKGWLDLDGKRITLEPDGLKKYSAVLTNLKALEDHCVAELSEAQQAEALQFLQAIIIKTADDLPQLLSS